MKKILIADDHGLYRDGMAIWLEHYPEPVQIDVASSWASLTMLLDIKFDLLMLDLDMPGMSGASSISVLKKQISTTPILVVSANEDCQTIHACLESGAAGYVSKVSDGQDILKAVDIVLKGGRYQPTIENQSITDPSSAIFSKKQCELLAFLAKGYSNKTIAQQMNLSEGTIKQYVSLLLTMLNVDNRTQAGIKAQKILGF